MVEEGGEFRERGALCGDGEDDADAVDEGCEAEGFVEYLVWGGGCLGGAGYGSRRGRGREADEGVVDYVALVGEEAGVV